MILNALLPNCFKTRLDKFGLTKMLCMTLKHHSWELEVEVILSVTVLFIVAYKTAWLSGDGGDCNAVAFQSIGLPLGSVLLDTRKVAELISARACCYE